MEISRIVVWSVIYEKPYEAKTGFGRAVWCLSKAFITKGIGAHIICSVFDAPEGIYRRKIDGIILHEISVTGNALSKRIKFYRYAYRCIINYINKNCTNIFLLHGPFSLLLVLPLKNLGIVVYHTFGTLLFELKSTLLELIKVLNVRKLLQYALEIPIETIFSGKVDLLVLPHHKASQEFQRLFKIKKNSIIIMPYGQDFYERFNDEKFFLKVDSFKRKFYGKQLILFVGGSSWDRKGARFVLLSFDKISKKLPSILVMTGRPIKEYLNLITRLGLKINENVILPGLVDDETLALLYASCDIFVLPSLHEGFSQPVLEVMAYGKPVVVSPQAGYPVVSNGVEGFIVNPKDVEMLSISIEKLLTDISLYRCMSFKAKQKAEKYSWNQIGYFLIKRILKIQIKENII